MKSVSYLDDPISLLDKIDAIDAEMKEKYEEELIMPRFHQEFLFFLSFH